MQTSYSQFTRFIIDLFRPLSDFFQPLGVPFGPIAWFFIVSVTPLVLIIVGLAWLRHKSTAGGIAGDLQKIIASTGDISGGISGSKKTRFINTPTEALLFLRIEENALRQALSAVDYYSERGELDDTLQSQLDSLYKTRLESVKDAIAKSDQLKAIVDADSAVDKARSDYLRKLAAMSGRTLPSEEPEAGPSSVGMPGEAAEPAEVTPEQPPTSEPETAPPAEAPSGGPPGGGPPGGAAPSGGPPSGGPPSGGPPGGSAPSDGPPGDAAPSGGPPGGGPPGGAAPSGGPPSGSSPSSGPPGGTPAKTPSSTSASEAPSSKEKESGAKSTLQSEMLAEMERLRTLMGGD
ncbi:MAG: hypothetical protein GF309_13030 [Candidatus Lokiarchaeota archaeon]|nr:hypothetical protein [Candidatus Lokiarchaeota archaeon]